MRSVLSDYAVLEVSLGEIQMQSGQTHQAQCI